MPEFTNYNTAESAAHSETSSVVGINETQGAADLETVLGSATWKDDPAVIVGTGMTAPSLHHLHLQS